MESKILAILFLVLAAVCYIGGIVLATVVVWWLGYLVMIVGGIGSTYACMYFYGAIKNK